MIVTLIPLLFAAQPLLPLHPLEPLSEPELRRAAALVRADSRFAPGAQFATLGF
jgi:Cu2+-containing amine oxidase